MFELEKIKGNTFRVRNGTNIGVYIFEDKTALLIDTGVSGEPAEKLIETLKAHNLDVRYIINTHGHWDHCGANHQIKETYKNAKTYFSKGEKVYIEAPEIFMDYFNGGKRVPELDRIIKKNVGVPDIVDENVRAGEILELNGHKFSIFGCAGHTAACIGVVTDDKVAFFGDAMISKNSFDKFDFVFMYDHAIQMKTLRKIKKMDIDYGVMGHSSKIFTKEEIYEAAEYNNSALTRIRKLMIDILDRPKSIDEITQEFFIKKKRKSDYFLYLECRSSLTAALEYLIKCGKINYSVDNNILKYKIADQE
ncbi:MBL fold metallo-hydrolase [Peptostreptococcus russellii]|uniref:MBL fold metallo-hydrolase n=1 Tax=Peptostreptococcus russellii TaxID=215200 RepID=UPI001624F71F|nr:MBL fold metallo-hydrolase [Peptostreptococcus russellii]MBC2578234.1 MBL fold metallo-hydrolase [Peptostreptococcus russellii]